MKASRRTILATLWTIIGGILLLFQACSGCDTSVKFRANNGGSDTQSSVSGNGEPYDYKPEPGEYYRIVPGFHCNSRPEVFAKIAVTERDVILESTDRATCSPVQQSLRFTDLQSSALKAGVLGYRDGIFEKRIRRPVLAELKGPLPETWCRTSLLNDPVEILVHENSELGTYRLRRFTSSGSAPDEQLVTKRLDAQVLRYHAPQFTLKVQLAASPAYPIARLIWFLKARSQY